MIEKFYIKDWQQQVPWLEEYQVEQDLIISRALINLYEREKIREALVFRGGTALNKLFIKPPARYSEDIDLVQINAGPIGKIIDEIRDALSWLGEPKWESTKRCFKLYYQYTSSDNKLQKLKIEINTTEHFKIFNLLDHEFIVNSLWFNGQTIIKTYQLNELMGTKLRALYQRNKGRDLFDLYIVLKNNLIDCKAVIDAFQQYMIYQKLLITRAQFEQNLFAKKQSINFQSDVNALLSDQSLWLFDEACNLVLEKLITQLPGEPFKIK